MKVVLAAFMASLGAVVACAQESVYVEAVRCVGGTFGMKLPADARRIRSMGLVRDIVSEVEQWDGYTATRKTLYFDGLELGVVDFSNDPGRVMITYAVITSPKWNRLLPFKIRRPISEARSLLGAPAKADDGLTRVYASESDSVQFQISGGSVVGVSYSCYSG